MTGEDGSSKPRKILLSAAAPMLVAGIAQADVVKIVNNDGSWSTSSLVDGDYVDIAASGTERGSFFGAKAGGGVDKMYFAGSWVTEDNVVGGIRRLPRTQRLTTQSTALLLSPNRLPPVC